MYAREVAIRTCILRNMFAYSKNRRDCAHRPGVLTVTPTPVHPHPNPCPRPRTCTHTHPPMHTHPSKHTDPHALQGCKITNKHVTSSLSQTGLRPSNMAFCVSEKPLGVRRILLSLFTKPSPEKADFGCLRARWGSILTRY